MEDTQRPQTLIQEIEVTFDCDLLQARIFALFELLDETESEVSVLLIGDEEMKALNATWRGEDRPTDVLSFSMREGEEDSFHGEMLGDIAISVETAARTLASQTHLDRVAQELSLSRDGLLWDLLDEVTFLVIHGALHLLGHDHLEPDEERRMKVEEARLMRALWARERR